MRGPGSVALVGAITLGGIFLGQRAYGFAAASEAYFGKALKDVTVAEAAMLAGLPNIAEYLCTDAVPVSTFLSEYYLRFRGLQDRATVVPLDEIEGNIQLQKRMSGNAPYYVLGPLPCDIGAGYDHVTAAVGAASLADGPGASPDVPVSAAHVFGPTTPST